ncbi:hypothetical protein AAY473_030348 [Plecturocebus cupreus]
MDERWRVLQATSKWLEEHVPADYQNPQEYVIQGKEGSPTQFYERLCEAYCTYTPIDPGSPENQRVINITLVSVCKLRGGKPERKSWGKLASGSTEGRVDSCCCERNAPKSVGKGGTPGKPQILPTHACNATSVPVVKKKDTGRKNVHS